MWMPHPSLHSDKKLVSSSKPSSSSSTTTTTIYLLLWYIFCGILHELSHYVVYYYYYYYYWMLALRTEKVDSFDDPNDDDVLLPSSTITASGTISFLYELLLGRSCPIQLDDHDDDQDTTVFWIRHSGWIGSSIVLMIAVLLQYHYGHDKNKNNNDDHYRFFLMASFVTLLEALSTDLFLWKPLLPIYNPRAIFFCGNFGILILNPVWLQHKDSFLDVLQEMVSVTMMRGAQSAGVVFYHNSNKDTTTTTTTVAGRSRVVNYKRTDLSVLMRRQLQKELRRPESLCPLLAGHTRFATSSKATLDGTHPHRWTEPSGRRVYDHTIGRVVVKNQITVTNYITHNGDFDFYSFGGGKTYDIETIREWIAVVTHTPAPAPVDSVAIAGLVDILRTKSCFGLSCRFAATMAMSTSDMTTLIQQHQRRRVVFPSYGYWQDTVGTIFEHAVDEYAKAASLPVQDIGSDLEKRKELSSIIYDRFVERMESPDLKPLLKLLNNGYNNNNNNNNNNKEYDLEATNPHHTLLKEFATKVVDAFYDNDLFFAIKTFMDHAKGSFGLSVTSTLDSAKQMCLASRGQTMSVAFYPDKGLVCYGSEAAATKAGMTAECPPGSFASDRTSSNDIDNVATRLDLDDLGGEIIVLDWSKDGDEVVSLPNRHLVETFTIMDGSLRVAL
jgi:hypothetical protein